MKFYHHRPRTVTPSDEELIKLGEELIEWAQKDDSLIMPQFYSVYKKILRKHWKSIVQNQIFLPYYEQAQTILGTKQITGKLKEGIAHRFLRLYHSDVKEDEDEVANRKNNAMVNQFMNLASFKEKLENGEGIQK